MDIGRSDASNPAQSQERFAEAHELIVRAESAGNVAVVHTPAGAAQFFAGHLDRSAAFDPVGSVAGDDTIIIVMRTPEEAAEMRKHPRIGYEIIKDSPSTYLRMGALIALGIC